MLTKLTCFSFFSLISSVISLHDVTDKIFGSNNIGTLAAFGDFNADKHTDIFVVSEDGSSVFVYLADSEKSFKQLLLVNVSNVASGSKITSIVPADLDGDLQMDILVASENVSSQEKMVSLTVYWGRGSSVEQNAPVHLPDMVDQPLLLDVNADMIPDLLGEKAPGERYYFIFDKNRKFVEQKFPGEDEKGIHPRIRKPQSGAFVDLNNDLTADLCIVTVVNETSLQLEYWLNMEGILTLDRHIFLSYEKALKVIGQFTFVDLDGDLNVEVLVPVCADDSCEDSFILLYDNVKWIQLPINFDSGGMRWNFIPPTESGAPGNLMLPMTLRVGDFNLDGYPDLLAVLGNNVSQRAVILRSTNCDGGCSGFSRTFSVDWDTYLEGLSYKALLPAFYDLEENGILDVIVNSMDSQGVPRIHVMKHMFVDDACFIKVTVVSGLCNYDCPDGRKPYGVNQPGPVIRYKTTDLHGQQQQRAGTQLTQSAYLPLQLPYIVFGLGQTPNFIDTLEVGIPTNTTTFAVWYSGERYRTIMVLLFISLPHEKILDSSKLKAFADNKIEIYRTKDWQSVIPNSQLVIIPYPINDPSSWVNKLFVTPSRLILLTGAALLGTCGFIAGIVGILHWRDKIEDRKEKRQEAQKFHFDAM